jgi:hypothetical protein
MRECGPVKTTFDLPDNLVERVKIESAKRRCSMKRIVIEGLEAILRDDKNTGRADKAIQRLRQGYRLVGKPMSREEIHAR